MPRKVVGFFTKGRGKKRKVIPITVSSKGKSIVLTRSARALAIDKALKAKITDDIDKYAKNPNRLDIKGVDYPSSGENIKTQEPKEPWMKDEPFTKDEVDYYNMFHLFDVDINKEFKERVKDVEDAIKDKLGSYGISKFSPEVKKALYYYRKALYEYYLADAKANAIAPSPMVVGPAKYKGNTKKADKIRKKAIDKVKVAEHYIEKAIAKNIKGKLPLSTKKAIKKSKLKHNNIKSTKLKKDLGLKSVVTSYNYKYKDGTGSVMKVLWTKNHDAYALGYRYYKDGTAYHFEVGEYGRALDPIHVETYDDLIKELKKIMQKK